MALNPQVKRIMEGLRCSQAEAEQIYQDDLAVDRMSMTELNATMTEDEKAVVKAMTRAQRAVNAYGKTVVRERKADTDKETLIAKLAELLNSEGYNEVVVTNVAREITFKAGDRKLKLTLSAPR